jgi:hypothetical protein
MIERTLTQKVTKAYKTLQTAQDLFQELCESGEGDLESYIDITQTLGEFLNEQGL